MIARVQFYFSLVFFVLISAQNVHSSENAHQTPEGFCKQLDELVSQLVERNDKFIALNAYCDGDDNDCTWDFRSSQLDQLYPSYAKLVLSTRSCGHEHWGLRSNHPFDSGDLASAIAYLRREPIELGEVKRQRFYVNDNYVAIELSEKLGNLYLRVD